MRLVGCSAGLALSAVCSAFRIRLSCSPAGSAERWRDTILVKRLENSRAVIRLRFLVIIYPQPVLVFMHNNTRHRFLANWPWQKGMDSRLRENDSMGVQRTPILLELDRALLTPVRRPGPSEMKSEILFEQPATSHFYQT